MVKQKAIIITIFFLNLRCRCLLLGNTHVWPEAQGVQEGINTIIMCDSESTPKWMLNNVILKISRNKRLISNNLTLLLENVSKLDEGQYVCLGVNEQGDPFSGISILRIVSKLEEFQSP